MMIASLDRLVRGRRRRLGLGLGLGLFLLELLLHLEALELGFDDLLFDGLLGLEAGEVERGGQPAADDQQGAEQRLPALGLEERLFGLRIEAREHEAKLKGTHVLEVPIRYRFGAAR